MSPAVLRVFKTRRLASIVALACGCAFGAGLLSTVLVRRAVHHKAQVRPAEAVRNQTTLVVTHEKRKVYPYSIVPGGAASLKEAKRAMSDPAVRNHYAAFDLKNLRQVTLTSDLVGYVSYRYGDKIFWTAKKLRLKAGETVYTDGVHVARGRCLNCYSALPMMPTRRNEPSESTMNTPVEVPLIALAFPNLPVATAPPAILPPPPPAPKGQVAGIVPGGGGVGGGVPGHPGFGFFPILPIVPPIHRSHHPTPINNIATNPPPPNPPSGPVPPTSVVPEPSYVWLLAGAFGALIFFRRVRFRRDSRVASNFEAGGAGDS